MVVPEGIFIWHEPEPLWQNKGGVGCPGLTSLEERVVYRVFILESESLFDYSDPGKLF